jgi:hypothetical protein
MQLLQVPVMMNVVFVIDLYQLEIVMDEKHQY